MDVSKQAESLCHFTWGAPWEKAIASKEVYTACGKLLVPSIDESLNFDDTGNILIEGDNLDALKLLSKTHRGKIRLIYIDPPYNTKDDRRAYNDTFTTREWLNMMYPRLILARDLLTVDGSIFISIDDKEHHRLRMLLDDIFGHFVGNVIWERSPAPNNTSSLFAPVHEHIVCYAKDKRYFRLNRLPRAKSMDDTYKNPDNDPKGNWQRESLDGPISRNGEQFCAIVDPKTGQKHYPPKGRAWKYSQETIARMIENGEIQFNRDGKPWHKSYLKDVQPHRVIKTIWPCKEVSHTMNATQQFKKLFNKEDDPLFPSPKPIPLLERILHIASDKDSIVLDFFSGSGSFGHAVITQNIKDGGRRKFIMVQRTEQIAKHHGDVNIADIGKERLRRVAKGITDKDIDCGFKVLKVVDIAGKLSCSNNSNNCG